MIVAVLQDDFTVAAISEEVAGCLDGWVVKELTGVLGNKLSQKEAASEPFAKVYSAIRAIFDTRLGSTMVRPNRPVVKRLRAMVSTWSLDEIARWEVDNVERLAGLVYYIVAYLDSRKVGQAR